MICNCNHGLAQIHFISQKMLFAPLHFMQWYPFHTRTTQMGTLANSEDPDEMRRNALFYQRDVIVIITENILAVIIISFKYILKYIWLLT